MKYLPGMIRVGGVWVTIDSRGPGTSGSDLIKLAALIKTVNAAHPRKNEVKQ